jgi:tRNA(Ile)-lysidine synthase
MSKLTPEAGQTGPEAVRFDELAEIFRQLEGYDTLYLAVSGGADSMALLHLVADWRVGTAGGSARAVDVRVVSVDHGLRPEAREEAGWVVAEAGKRGLSGEVLTVAAEPPESGIQEWARDQRYNMLCARVVLRGGATALVTGHHQGDVAETVLMRLARGSGVDGLAAMAVKTVRDGADIVRPLLGIAKGRLTATLESRGAAWIEDPSNASDTFERVRLRKLEAERVALGLGDEALGRTASRLGRARAALDTVSEALLEVAIDAASLAASGVLRLPARFMRDLPDEIGLRMLMRALVAVGGAHGQLRLSRLERLFYAIQDPDFTGATLGNAIVRSGEAAIPGLGDAEQVLEIYREPDRGRLPVVETTLEAPVVWDNRFVVSREGAGAETVRIRAFERRDLAMLLGADEAERLSLHEAMRSTPVIEASDGRHFAPALASAGLGAGDGMGPPAGPYRARFMVERLFTGRPTTEQASSERRSRDSEFVRLLTMAFAMRDKSSAPGSG